MVQVAGQLGELGASALLLALLLFAPNLLVVIFEVPAHFFVLCLDVLQVLLAGVEVVLPSATVIAAIAANKIMFGLGYQVSVWMVAEKFSASTVRCATYNF